MQSKKNKYKVVLFTNKLFSSKITPKDLYNRSQNTVNK